MNDIETGRSEDALVRAVRNDWGRLLAALTHQFGDLALAEDALQDALEIACRRWPIDGEPDNPAGWLFISARRHVRQETSPARFQTDPADAERIANQFIAAAANGDLQALLPLLDPDVTGHADGGGVVPATRGPLVGRDVVAKGMIGFLRAFDATLVPMKVNGEQGVLAMKEGRLLGIMSISIRDGRIVNLHAIANPYKLTYAASVLDTELYRKIEPGATSYFIEGLPAALRGRSPN